MTKLQWTCRKLEEENMGQEALMPFGLYHCVSLLL